jgi:uncharacterized C2H2 Zn-finger protein
MLTNVGLVLNSAIDRIICTVCETVIPVEQSISHLKLNHPQSLEENDAANLEAHITSLRIPLGLPSHPNTVIPAVQGLAIDQGFYCPHCLAAYPSVQSYGKHVNKHKLPTKGRPTVGPVQQFNKALGRSYFRVTVPTPSAQVDVDAKKPILDILKDIEDRQRSLVAETDIRNVSPWLRITQWHEVFKEYDTKGLRAMVEHPSDVEFPYLQDAVLFTFQEASNLIDTTTTLVLQTLRSPDKEYAL